MTKARKNLLENLSIEELKLLARIPVENPNPIMQVGFDGTLRYANQAFFNLQSFKNESIGSLVGPSLKGPVDLVALEGKNRDFEIPDGSHFFLFTLMPVADLKLVFLYGKDITKRKLAERELQQMALIAKETGNAVIITDPEGKVQWINQSFIDFTGFTFEEIQGKVPGDLLQGPETDPVAVQNMARAIKNRQSIEQDVVNYSKSGVPYWIKIQIQPVFNEEGELVNFISIQQNITQEKILRKELVDNEEKLRLILESALDGVIIIDEAGLVRTWTRQAETIFGFSDEEVAGKPLRNFIVPERLKEAHSKGLERYMSTGVPKILNQRIEVPGIRKNGEEFPVELTIIPIRNESGQIFCAFIRDLSEQKQARAKLESTTSRLSALISNLNAGVLVEDENRFIALINAQFCAMFGIPVDPAVLVGTDCSQSAEQSKGLFKDPLGFVSKIDELLSTHELSLSEELELADGRVFERDYVPVFNEGIFMGNLWQYRDISERKHNERLLEVSKRMAETANRAKSTFLANMSHEIRTPMNAVHGIVRLLAEAPHLPEQKNLHDRLIASSETLLSIINDILDFSKIEAGLLTLERIPFALKEVIARVAGSLEIKAGQKSLQLVHSCDDDIESVLLGDPVRLGQILLNLVNNAIKFTVHGKVEMSCQLKSKDTGSNTVYFSVKDTGIGIEKSRLEKIFESYEQEEVSTTRQFGGTGLGLSISKQLVELMGGILEVESEKNQGSNFHFTITLERSAGGRTLDNNALIPVDNEKLRGCRVLVVEDNEMNQFVANAILSKWNMTVVQVRNGQEAIDFLSSNNCDIVLMDKQMPVMGGIEATRFIRGKMKSSIPIIALTADAVIEMVQECLDAGMNDYVTKPFEPVVLFNKIIQVLP